MDYSRMGGVYGPDPEQMALISRLKDQNAPAQAPGGVAPPVRMTPPPVAAAPPPSANYGPVTDRMPSPNGGVAGRQVDPTIDRGSFAGPAAPASPSAQGKGPSQAPPGWDTAKWNDPNKHDPKYDIGHLIADDHTSADLQADMPEIQKLYPGAVFDGKDVVTIPGYGGIDMLQGASTGHGMPQWMPVGGGGNAPATGPIGMTSGTIGAPGAPPQAPQMDDTLWQQLMAKLQTGQDMNAQLAGQPSSQAVASLLRG